jgi:broad specificity phosphatase PhoE
VSRRRLYLLRHAEVAYFDEHGRPLPPDDAALTAQGREQALATAEALRGVRLDRVLTSGVKRTVETAQLVAPGAELEAWPDLRELVPGRLAAIPADELGEAFLGAFRGAVPESRTFLGGETVGSLLDRVLPALERLLADMAWDVVLAVLHGGVNRAILSYALTGRRSFLGGFEQAPACVNVIDVGDDWIVRAVNVTPYDLVHRHDRSATMERLYAEYRP